MRNFIKVTLLTLSGLFVMVASSNANADNVTKGMGKALWYSGNCESMTIPGDTAFATLLASKGITVSNITSDADLMSGFQELQNSSDLVGLELTCAAGKIVLAPVYDLLFK